MLTMDNHVPKLHVLGSAKIGKTLDTSIKNEGFAKLAPRGQKTLLMQRKTPLEPLPDRFGSATGQLLSPGRPLRKRARTHLSNVAENTGPGPAIRPCGPTPRTPILPYLGSPEGCAEACKDTKDECKPFTTVAKTFRRCGTVQRLLDASTVHQSHTL